MNLTEEQLAEIEELGRLFFGINEVAIVLDVDRDAFMAEVKVPMSAAYLHYYRGVLTSEKLIRKSVISLAEQGSPAAQEMANKLLDKCKGDLL